MWPASLPKNPSQPPVSLLTPTYNRRKFIPWLIQCIQAQTYPTERMEWLIYDDGTDPIEDLLTPYITSMNIRYFRAAEGKLNIGAKRNKLHAEARGEILVTMDDDDYYPPERVSHAVHTLLSKKAPLAGSSINHLYFTDDRSIWRIGPYNLRHGTFGTMAYTKAYAMSHPCDESKTNAEEVEFTESYKAPLVQLDPLKVMCVMCHSENTFSKDKLRNVTNPLIKKTDMKLKAFIRSAALRDFYTTCGAGI
jgi:glycosyltransferase involved in cell wall biosynthesis